MPGARGRSDDSSGHARNAVIDGVPILANKKNDDTPPPGGLRPAPNYFDDDDLDLGFGAIGDKPAGRELRDDRRMPMQLKTALVYHQHGDAASRPTFHGTSHDISMSGLTLIVEQNIFTEDEVTVLIALPPAHVGIEKKVIEATARMVYTVYTSEYQAFRVGLTFREFKRDGEQRLKVAIGAMDQYFGN